MITLVTVKIDGVVKRFGEIVALKGVSLEIKHGELFTLLGPSGCGKTTLLRIIAGLEYPDEGRVYFDGSDVTDLKTYERGAVLVFQNYALWPHMTVYENIAYGLKIRKVPRDEIKERVKRALELVKLEGYEDRYPTQLSGGQQQRVALARALAVQPKLLLLDEPLSNLDAKLRIEMRSEIKRIQRELDITVIYVTHDQEEAMALSDRVAVMNFGVIEQVGTPREIYQRPKTKFVADFMGKNNILPAKILEIKNGRATLEVLGHRISGIPAENILGDYSDLYFSIRPEKVSLTPFEGAQAFEGRVDLVEYYGFFVEIVIKIKDMFFFVRVPDLKEPLKQGDNVKVYFNPRDVILLQE